MPNPLYVALAQAQLELPNIPTNQTANTGKFSYKYADLSAILSETLPVLNKHGIALTQMPDSDGLITMLLHGESGECLTSRTPIFVSVVQSARDREAGLPAPDPTPRDYQGAITSARRIAIMCMLGITTVDEDTTSQQHYAAPHSQPQRSQPVATDAPKANAITDKQIAVLGSLTKELELDPVRARAFFSWVAGRDVPVKSSKELTKSDAMKILDAVKDDEAKSFRADPGKLATLLGRFNGREAAMEVNRNSKATPKPDQMFDPIGHNDALDALLESANTADLPY